MTTVAVVCVTHDSADVLPALLDSLPEAAGDAIELRCCIVDSGSTDASLAIARDRPGVEVIDLGRNAGYAAGINAGARALAGFDALCVLNPDVRLQPGSLASLAETLLLPGTGIAAPRVVNASGETRCSLRRAPSVARALGDAVLGGNLAGRVPLLGEMEVRSERYAHPAVVDWATGAVLLISRECCERVGPWDERFFLYSEEVDYALRAHRAGFVVRYDPRAVVRHEEGEYSRSPELASLLCVNRVRCFRKHHALVPSAAFYGAVLLNEVARSRNPIARGSALALLLRRRRPESARGFSLLGRPQR